MKITKEQLIERFQNESEELISGEKKNLIRELIQETILCHMKEIGLFKDMAFHGGTSLRLLYRADRFSEDLDLSLLKADQSYDLPSKMEILEKSLSASGFSFEFQNRCKASNSIKTFYINDTSILNLFREEVGNIIDGEKIKIKLELDVLPAEHQEFTTVEIKSPFAEKIYAHNLSTCMGQKIHAVLCRSHAYEMNIVKGRDLYDLEWYLKKKVKPNYQNLGACLMGSGPWKNKKLNIDKAWVAAEVGLCLKTKNFSQILLDVRPLIRVGEFERIRSLWSQSYFSELLEHGL